VFFLQNKAARDRWELDASLIKEVATAFAPKHETLRQKRDRKAMERHRIAAARAVERKEIERSEGEARGSLKRGSGQDDGDDDDKDGTAYDCHVTDTNDGTRAGTGTGVGTGTGSSKAGRGLVEPGTKRARTSNEELAELDVPGSQATKQAKTKGKRKGPKRAAVALGSGNWQAMLARGGKGAKSGKGRSKDSKRKNLTQ